jgi:hypothetical protein
VWHCGVRVMTCSASCRTRVLSMAVIKDAAWFHEHHGLRNFGEDVLALSKKEIPKSKICEVFGPMSSKSG